MWSQYGYAKWNVGKEKTFPVKPPLINSRDGWVRGPHKLDIRLESYHVITAACQSISSKWLHWSIPPPSHSIGPGKL